jgi:ketosteroid isomerase-like protein
MNLDDRLAILECIARYSYAYDGKDADAFANHFTEDGVWELFDTGATSPAARIETRPAIREWVSALHERLGAIVTRHFQSGTLFDELTPTTARTRTMLLVTHQHGMDRTPRPTRSGVYHDEWRKTPDGWRLAHRVLRHDKGLEQ